METDVYRPIAGDLRRVNEAIEGVAHAPNAMTSGAAQRLAHVLAIPGKRLRPAITLLASRLWGGPSSKRVVAMAVAIELLHIATLVHDDTVDHADLRRGHATAANLWGPAVALVIGDYLFATSARFVCDTNDLRVIRRFSENSRELARGELTELLDLGSPRVTREIYEQRIYDKTASLFTTAAEGGAILGGADEEGVERLRAYGYNVGMAYQVMDDVLDFESTPETLGKPAGQDLAGGTVTLPAILVMERSPGPSAVSELLAAGAEAEPALVERAVSEVKSSGALAEARGVVEGYIGAAVKALKPLPASPERDSLL
ncbi:MAG: polyprenyl synthetase family protein, partial [Gemmatimonadetes bacterium]|nr:polyprenyl synthetase family protein [Gemmatimonadota bacterium]